MTDFKEGDWAAYNWLTEPDENGYHADEWKIGRIVRVERTGELMYYNDDGTSRSGCIPLTSPGVKKLTNE